MEKIAGPCHNLNPFEPHVGINFKINQQTTEWKGKNVLNIIYNLVLIISFFSESIRITDNINYAINTTFNPLLNWGKLIE